MSKKVWSSVEKNIPTLQPKSGKIPQGVGIAQNPSDIEEEPFLISFKWYQDRNCDLNVLDRSKIKKVIEIFKRLGKASPKRFSEVGLRTQPIANNGTYSELFPGLTEDVNLLEHNLGDSERMFYFLDASVFYVRAFKKKHY